MMTVKRYNHRSGLCRIVSLWKMHVEGAPSAAALDGESDSLPSINVMTIPTTSGCALC